MKHKRIFSDKINSSYLNKDGFVTVQNRIFLKKWVGLSSLETDLVFDGVHLFTAIMIYTIY